MSFSERAFARFDGAHAGDLITHCAAHAREADLPVDETPDALSVALPHARVGLSLDGAGFTVSVEAQNAAALQQMREYVLFLLDHVSPGVTQEMTWTGDFLRNAAPPNLHMATVSSVRRVGRTFLRVELDCPGARALSEGKGMHFSLLLPPEGRAPVWPRLDGDGRTIWPQGEDGLHRAVYTFVTLEPEAGRFSFDLFEHEGGRATGWAQSVRPGEMVGITGPGGGGLPPGDVLLMAGDETALPAIRRILERSDSGRRGDVFIEVASEADICDMPRPEGVSLEWVIRERGGSLWDRLCDRPAPEGESRFVWVAAEQALIRKAKARFRGELGLRREEGYFAFYWVA